MSKILNISKNTRSAYILGRNPDIKLEGTTKERVHITGTGRLNLNIGQANINNYQALLIQGFDVVFIFGDGTSVLRGGIKGNGNKAYFISNLVIDGGEIGVHISTPEYIDHIDLSNLIIRNCSKEGVYLGPSRADRSWIKKVIAENLIIIDTKWDNFQVGSSIWTHVKDCVFKSKYSRPFGQDKDIMINPYCKDVKVENTNFDSVYVHKNSQINII